MIGMNSFGNDSIFAFLVIMVVLYSVGIIIYLATEKFRAQTRYIKLEIKRNTGEKQLYWEEELKRHRLRSLPVIGKWLERKLFKNIKN